MYCMFLPEHLFKGCACCLQSTRRLMSLGIGTCGQYEGQKSIQHGL